MLIAYIFKNNSNRKANQGRGNVNKRGAHLETSQNNIVKYTFEGNPRFRLYFLLGLSSLSF